MFAYVFVVFHCICIILAGPLQFAVVLLSKFFKIIAAILTTFLILLPGTYVPRSWCTEGGS